MDYKEHTADFSILDFWFKARRRRIYIQLSKLNKKNLKILDLGAGTGDDLLIQKKFGEIYAVDIEKKALNQIPGDLCVEKKVADACKLPYKDKFFDVVTSFEVLEHVTNDTLVVSEIMRVLKDDGYLIFSVPAFQFVFSSHDKALKHKRRYNKKMLRHLFSEFNDIQIKYWNSILFLPIVLMRLVKRKSEAEIDQMKIPKIVDKLFYNILEIENELLKRDISLPIGLSIVGCCKKKK